AQRTVVHAGVGTIALTSGQEKRPTHTALLPLVVVLITGSVLVYGTMDMPRFGDPDAPASTYLAPDFIEGSETQIDVPNIVTSVLASYRGFDTLGETGVIFTAGIAVMLLLGGKGAMRRRRPLKPVPPEEAENKYDPNNGGNA
ncbi:MAG: hydrogen gas-evolving membrane-bound hydrogenase subunit E, partial [Alphaproteobacteria bacterium]